MEEVRDNLLLHGTLTISKRLHLLLKSVHGGQVDRGVEN